jgi:hypothetical protein
MTMRKHLQLLFLFALAISLVGCGGGDADESTSTDQTSSNNQDTEQNSEPDQNSESTSSSGDQISLRLALSPGDSYVIHTTALENTTQSAFGQDVDSGKATEMKIRYDVESVDSDGTMAMVASYEVFKTSTGEGETDIAFDSEDPNQDFESPEGRILSSMIGQELQLELSPLGEISNVHGFDSILDGMIDEIDPAMRELLDPFFRTLFGNQAMAEMMQNLYTAFPEEPVGIGDSWTRSSVVSIGVSFMIDTTFTLTARADGVATLETESIISTNADAEPIDFGIFQMGYSNMNGTQSGFIQIDESNGLMKLGSLSQDFSGELQMISADTEADNINVPIIVGSTFRYEIIEGP